MLNCLSQLATAIYLCALWKQRHHFNKLINDHLHILIEIISRSIVEWGRNHVVRTTLPIFAISIPFYCYFPLSFPLTLSPSSFFWVCTVTWIIYFNVITHFPRGRIYCCCVLVLVTLTCIKSYNTSHVWRSHGCFVTTLIILSASVSVCVCVCCRPIQRYLA